MAFLRNSVSFSFLRISLSTQQLSFMCQALFQVLGREWWREPDSGRYLLLLELPRLGLGTWERRVPTSALCLTGPLSPQTPLLLHTSSLLLLSPSPWIWFGFTPSCPLVSYCPCRLRLFICQSSSLCALLCMDTFSLICPPLFPVPVFFLLPHLGNKSLLANCSGKLTYLFIFGGEKRVFDLLYSLLTSSSCSDLFFSNIPSACNYSLSLNLLCIFEGQSAFG